MPAVFFFVVTFYFEDKSPNTEDGEKEKTRRNEDNSESKACGSATAVGIEMKEVPENEALCPGVSSPTPEGKGNDRTPKFCTLCRYKTCHSLLIAFIWLIFVLLDGRYVSCACSYWEGKYTVTDSFIWCEPTGNDTMVFKMKTQMNSIISQVSSELCTTNTNCFSSR